MKVLWLANIPSPYRVNFFNEFGKNCDLTVLFEKAGSSERDKSWLKFKATNFKAVFLRPLFSTGVAEGFCPSVKKYLVKNKYDDIFVTNFSDLTGLYAISILKRRKIPYILESDGAFIGSGKGIKEIIKKWVISDAKLCFSTADAHDKYYLFYGCKREKLVRYPFTSLYSKDILNEPLSYEKKQEFKDILGIKEDFVILSVGQFIRRKGFDILLKSLVGLPKTVGCYIIGGDPTDEYLKLKKEHNLDNVYFRGFKLKEEINKYYLAADLFVLPTREDIWGLVINEAMAKAVPVITTDRCVAGLELVQNTNSGKIVPVDDVDSLRYAMTSIIENKEIFKMQNNSLETVKRYTFENMAKVHIEELIQNGNKR